MRYCHAVEYAHTLIQQVQKRQFNVIQRGNDRQLDSLFTLLGFGKDSEARRAQRSRSELRQGFIHEAMKLKDPKNSVEDAAKMAKLCEAYKLLSDDRFRSQYASHHYASPDAMLHVRVDGGQVAANFNPEHQSFEFVNHALSFASTAASQRVSSDAQRSFGDFTGPYQSAVGATSEFTEVRQHNPREAKTVLNGSNVNFTLRISFDESVLGCTKTVVYEKNVLCTHCGGHGRTKLARHRKCPQCRGRGSINLPSATYHIERQCTYCSGDGHAPAPKCSVCGGVGVTTGHTVSVPVDVRPGTTSMTVRRIRGKGHDGARGGASGDLVVTVLVQEHRLFHRDGMNLHLVMPIPLSVALLGGVVNVPLLDGQYPMRVPPCVRSGQHIVLVGKGVCPDNSACTFKVSSAEGDAENYKEQQQVTAEKRGDLYVHLLVVIPRGDELTGAQRCALEAFMVKRDCDHEAAQQEITPVELKKQFRHWLTSKC
ncbi:putative chaperone protein DNAj [Trypanosoma vivax]|uniref:Putative chaperone protein DNAj n=1 Tax=Trypanosoma vivax (strain Y486) TaxID=1055687 RepID=G0TR38_TRYVY|nr:putative chaperone protein DNAj [Trypanosoma vivax]KAH8611167.1 putative chaperone protein DNAj [Trypanosoma vivax]CCC46402.1 putative chaperone protein DNAj [Trypanosoma vivax Y486]